MNWKPNSWRNRPILQVPEYPEQNILENVEKVLKKKPPLVFAGEVQSLTEKLADVCLGKVFFFKEVIVLRVLLNFLLI